MEPTEEEIEALAKELREFWRFSHSERAIARHVLSRPAPPGTIRLGTGLTPEQMSWTIEGKRDMAAKYDDVAAALTGFPWAATAEGAQWQTVYDRFLQIAADLRIAVLRERILTLCPICKPDDEARAILTALDKMGGAGG